MCGKTAKMKIYLATYNKKTAQMQGKRGKDEKKMYRVPDSSGAGSVGHRGPGVCTGDRCVSILECGIRQAGGSVQC